MRTDEILLGIGDQLRFVLFGLSCLFNVGLDHAEVERLFDGGEGKEVSSEEKQYVFYASRHLSIAGRVDEYEPGDVWLRVESRKPFEPSLMVMSEWAKYQEYHVKRRQETES